MMSLKKYARLATICSFYMLCYRPAFCQPARILFDATKGEMAGNADWVIDADQTTLGVGSGGAYSTSAGHQSNPQRIPTPAQSGITTATPETYWSGALSSWAVDLVNRGYVLETLPWDGQITYGNTGNVQDLGNYDVLIVDEPNLKFSPAEKTAIVQYVKNGGSLFVISDHNGSDRNGDGWDSPAIWNDLFSTNSVQPSPFGFTFDLADFSQTTANISATPTDSLIHGPMGEVTQVKWSGGTTMTLNPAANSSVKGVIFKAGATPGNVNVMVAYSHFGAGKVAAMGDSSPTDDSTGNPNCTLYNGYWSDVAGNHRRLLVNTVIWLTEKNATTVVIEPNHEIDEITLYPNPSHGDVCMALKGKRTNMTITVYDITGNLIEKRETDLFVEDHVHFNLTPGQYIIRVHSDESSGIFSATVF